MIPRVVYDCYLLRYREMGKKISVRTQISSSFWEPFYRGYLREAEHTLPAQQTIHTFQMRGRMFTVIPHTDSKLINLLPRLISKLSNDTASASYYGQYTSH
jgi:hypothetical protein